MIKAKGPTHMNSANHAAMQEALKRKKAHGIQLTITVGHPGDKPGASAMEDHDGAPHEGEGHGVDPEEDRDRKELNLAPEATEIGEEADKKDEAIGHATHTGNLTPGAELINHPDPEGDKKMIEEALSKGHFGSRSLHRRAMVGKK